jgi:hypothetical protein
MFFFFLLLSLPSSVLQWHHEEDYFFLKYGQSMWFSKLYFIHLLSIFVIYHVSFLLKYLHPIFTADILATHCFKSVNWREIV